MTPRSVVVSEPVDLYVLTRALNGLNPQFADLATLIEPATLAHADLLILQYGSTVPAGQGKAIEEYLHAAGNLLIVGGQPFRAPVTEMNGKFVESRPQEKHIAGTLVRGHAAILLVGADGKVLSSFRWTGN